MEGKQKVALTFALYQNGALVRRETVTQDIVKVGKDAKSHLRIDDELASRMHAVIEVASPEDITLIDLGNEPGTLVNGARVNKCKINAGDQLQIGGTTIVFESAQPVVAAAAVAKAPANPFAAPPAAAATAPGAPASPFGGAAPASPFGALPSNPFAAAPAQPVRRRRRSVRLQQPVRRASALARRGPARRARGLVHLPAREERPRHPERGGREPGRVRGGHDPVGPDGPARLAPHAAALFLRRRGGEQELQVRLLHPVGEARHDARPDRPRGSRRVGLGRHPATRQGHDRAARAAEDDGAAGDRGRPRAAVRGALGRLPDGAPGGIEGEDRA
jgi:pSer/pThr/pTyr-binding forkhead associated (FHA) protein